MDITSPSTCDKDDVSQGGPAGELGQVIGSKNSQNANVASCRSGLEPPQRTKPDMNSTETNQVPPLEDRREAGKAREEGGGMSVYPGLAVQRSSKISREEIPAYFSKKSLASSTGNMARSGTASSQNASSDITNLTTVTSVRGSNMTGAKRKKAAPLSPIGRCTAAAVRGFAIGAGIKGGLALFAIIGRLQKQLSGRSNGKTLSKDLVSVSSIVTALKETLRFGCFLGTYAGGYSLVDELIISRGGLYKTRKWRPFVAGAIAGPSLLLTGLKTQHYSMALYILLRAAVLGVRCGVKSRKVGWLFRPLTWQHGDILLMCISTAQILYAWVSEPESLSTSYLGFLNKHGGKDRKIIDAIHDVARGERPIPKMDEIEKIYEKQGVNVSLDPFAKLPCGFIHPHQSCASHIFTFSRGAYVRAISMYLPVYFVSAFLVQRQTLFHRPLSILFKTFLGAARSSSFLALYCSSPWLYLCSLHHLLQRSSESTIAVASFPVGISLLLEKKSRRMEVALYCFSRAIESFCNCLLKWGWLPSQNKIPKRLDLVLFSLATAFIMHCYSNERDVFRSKYLNVIDWVFGVPPLLPRNEGEESSSVVVGQQNSVKGESQNLISKKEGKEL